MMRTKKGTTTRAVPFGMFYLRRLSAATVFR